MIFSSTVCKLTSLITLIFCFYLINKIYPILWALLIAYRSLNGLKSLSTKIIVFAEVKLIPYPPALVDNKKIKQFSSSLKLSI